MPVTYTIDAARRLIRTTCCAPVTFGEVIGHFHMLAGDPACAGHLDVLLDVSSADLLPEKHQLEAVSAELQALRGKVQFQACAIVASRDALFGMMRMFEVLAGRYFSVVHVFRSISEAESWIPAQQSSVEREK